MAVFVCPSCGYRNELSGENTSDTSKCTWCGEDASNPKKNAVQWPTHFTGSKENDRPETWKKGILIVAALGLAVAAVFVFTKSTSKKTPMHELNAEEVDNEIMAVGMGALEDHGWTESETAGYIEARIRVYGVENQRARNSRRSAGVAETKLKLRSTASDVKNLGRSELLNVQEQIAEREAKIKEFERLLAEYRPRTESKQ